MVDFILVNATDTQMSNVNVGGIDVPPRANRTATMTAAELLAFLQLDGAGAVKAGETNQRKREIARCLKYKQVSAGAAI